MSRPATSWSKWCSGWSPAAYRWTSRWPSGSAGSTWPRCASSGWTAPRRRWTRHGHGPRRHRTPGSEWSASASVPAKSGGEGLQVGVGQVARDDRRRGGRDQHQRPGSLVLADPALPALALHRALAVGQPLAGLVPHQVRALAVTLVELQIGAGGVEEPELPQ